MEENKPESPHKEFPATVQLGDEYAGDSKGKEDEA